MSTLPVKLRVLRNVGIKGVAHVAGDIVSCEPLDAGFLVAIRACEVVAEADREAIKAAHEAQRRGSPGRTGAWMAAS